MAGHFNETYILILFERINNYFQEGKKSCMHQTAENLTELIEASSASSFVAIQINLN